MATDDWVASAINNDEMVAEFLVSLKHRQSHVVEPFTWGHRKQRTKVLSSSTTARFVKADGGSGGDSARGSPTTPLSWSGGGGGAASGDGSDESSRFNGRCISSNRSKATVLNDCNTTATTSKSSKRKQTCSRLKERETVLQEQGVCLKKEISTTSFVDHRAQNKNSKKIKLDYSLQSSNGTTTVNPNDTVIASASTLLLPVAANHPSASGSCQPSNSEPSQRDRGFLVPDLNMMPSEEDSGSETTLYGTS